jgi:retinol dehydrogenase-12
MSENEIMNDKTVLITGATSGIGLATAKELARMGANVVLVGRNLEKCVSASAQITQLSGNGRVEYILADLSTRSGVQTAAREFLSRHSRLDVLLNNAGVFLMTREVTIDGFEMTFALNHLGYFYLTYLLLDTLKETGASRVVNVSSDAHRGAKIDFEDLQNERNYAGFSAYGKSKFANVLFTYELSRKLAGTQVTTNALHPGFVASEFGKNNGGFLRFAMKLMKPFQKTVEQGASTSIYLASSLKMAAVTGKYFADSMEVKSDPLTYDQSAAEMLWQKSLEMLV